MSRTDVTVTHVDGNRYDVRVADRTRHEVTVTEAVLGRVGRPGESPEAVLARAFAFLLRREPAESILRRFALEDIARYFPEFWSEMTRTSG